jgi:hypothetical protein
VGDNKVLNSPAPARHVRELERELKKAPQDLNLRRHIERLKEAWGLRRRPLAA